MLRPSQDAPQARGGVSSAYCLPQRALSSMAEMRFDGSANVLVLARQAAVRTETQSACPRAPPEPRVVAGARAAAPDVHSSELLCQ